MKKFMKVALVKDQLKAKNKIKGFDGYEIQLLDNLEENDFSLVKKLNKPIITIHYPFLYCDVSKFINDDYNKELFDKVVKICREYKSGLVIHMDMNYNDLSEKDFDKLKKVFKGLNINVYVENMPNIRAWQVITFCSKLNLDYSGTRFYPLLDICHFLMNQMDLSDDTRTLSLKETINIFSGENFVIHFADCTGSGEFETGGVHGDYFKNNQQFMENLLEFISNINSHANLILEVYEDDYANPQNAIWLNEQIDNFLKNH